MKKIATLLFLLLSLPVGELLAQCSGGSNGGTITPTLVWQTLGVSTGTRYTFSATAGNTYQFSFCNGGGSAGFDSQLTMLDNSGAYAGAYSDDVCGVASEISWTAPSSGNYRILVNDYYCLGSGMAATLAYRMFVPGPGATCGNPHNIPALPFTATGLTTCGAGNDYDGTTACASSYLNGEDYVFRYVAPAAQTVRITLSNTLGFTGVFVYQGCPSSGAASCIATSSTSGCSSGGATNTSSSGNPSADFNLPAAGTYYFIVDTWPSPNCTPFDINVQTVSSSGGPGCSSYAISTPAYNPDNFNSGTQLTFPDDQFSSALPLPFTFCFMGVNYNSIVVSSNAYVTFNTACAGLYSGWNTEIIPSPASTNRPEARNSIMFPWTDVDPGDGGTIRYNTYGTAPNRRFVVAFRNVPMFGSSCIGTASYTGEVVLYETSFVIDLYIENYSFCSAWNSGEGVIGLWDASGTVAVPVPGFNNTQFNLSNFARRFTPSCPTCGILPVSFTNVSGEYQSDRNLVTWTTAHEANTASFTLERSRDGSIYESVGSLEGAGNDPRGRTYQMEDYNRFSAQTFYRVVERDVNGTETISEVIMVSSNPSNFVILNAAVVDDELQLDIEAKSAAQKVKIELLDVLGKTVYAATENTASGANRFKLDIGKLSKGVYFVRATDQQGHQQSRKFIRN